MALLERFLLVLAQFADLVCRSGSRYGSIEDALRHRRLASPASTCRSVARVDLLQFDLGPVLHGLDLDGGLRVLQRDLVLERARVHRVQLRQFQILALIDRLAIAAERLWSSTLSCHCDSCSRTYRLSAAMRFEISAGCEFQSLLRTRGRRLPHRSTRRDSSSLNFMSNAASLSAVALWIVSRVDALSLKCRTAPLFSSV